MHDCTVMVHEDINALQMSCAPSPMSRQQALLLLPAEC